VCVCDGLVVPFFSFDFEGSGFPRQAANLTLKELERELQQLLSAHRRCRLARREVLFRRMLVTFLRIHLHTKKSYLSTFQVYLLRPTFIFWEGQSRIPMSGHLLFTSVTGR
jgi:hypothetical protein